MLMITHYIYASERFNINFGFIQVYKIVNIDYFAQK
jgi:hypothetical protein